MHTSGAEYFVAALEEYGVTHLFGNPGTTELPEVQATADSDIEYILGLHEDIAVGMAGGYSSTRRYHSHHDDSVLPLGVANLHVAPGLAHGLGNLIGADFAGAPILVTAGNYSTDFQHEEPILSGDLVPMVEQYTKWSAEVTNVNALPTMLRRAVRQALTPPTGPVFLGLPLDVMLADLDAPIERLGSIPTAGRGELDSIQEAAAVLAEASEPAFVVGDDVAHAGPDAIDAAVTLAEIVGARVHGEFPHGEVSFPQDHELWGGTVPSTEREFVETLETDTIVFIGTGSATTSLGHEEELLPRESTIVQLGPDTWELGKNWPADVSVIGDLGEVLPELSMILEDRVPDSDRQDRREQASRKATQLREKRKPSGFDPDEPRVSKGELGQAMNEAASDALVINEGVTAKNAIGWHVQSPPEGLLVNKSGGLGYALPAAVGAAIAEQQRPESKDVVAFVGDGTYFYYPQTIYSAVRHDVDLTVVVANNNNYRMLKDNTIRVLGGNEGDHEFVGMDLEPPLDIPTSARSYGAAGRTVEDPSQITAAITDGRNDDAVTVLDVLMHD